MPVPIPLPLLSRALRLFSVFLLTFTSLNALALTPQTIDTSGLPGTIVVGKSETPVFLTSAWLTLTLTSTTPTTCTVSGSSITGVAAGICSITLENPGDAVYAPVSQTVMTFISPSFDPPLPPQIIALFITSSASTVEYGKAITLSTLGGQGTGGVTFTSNSSNCAINGPSLTGKGIGSCIISATKAADSKYAAANAVSTFSVLVTKANQQALTATSSSQSVAFGKTLTLNTIGGTVTPSTTGTPDGIVSYSSSNGNCTISGNILTGAGVGSCTITATKAGDANYNPISTTLYDPIAQRAYDITVTQAVQPALTALSSGGSVVYGQTLTLSTAGGLGAGAVSYSSNNANCSISGNILTGMAIGSCSITATKAADTNYTAVTSKPIVIAVTSTAQAPVIVSASNNSVMFGQTLTLSSTGGNGVGAVTFKSDSPGCSISRNILTGSAIGSCNITATKAATGTFAAVTSAPMNITVIGASQLTLTVSAMKNSVLVGQTLPLNSMGGSGSGSLTFASNSPNCNINGKMLTAITAGSCSITVTKAADTNYTVATSAPIVITVTATPLTGLTATSSNSTMMFGQTITLSSAGGNAADTVRFVSDSAKCLINGTVLTATGAGSCTVVAMNTVEISNGITITIDKSDQVITLKPLSSSAVGVGVSTPLMATGGSSGLPVILTSSTPNICSVNNYTVWGVAAGQCSIIANQAGNRNYNPATSVTLNMTVATPASRITPVNGNNGNTTTNANANPNSQAIVVGTTPLMAGSNGVSVQTTTTASGAATVHVTSGSMDIPCSAAIAFCKSTDVNLSVFADEMVQFDIDGKVTRIEINPPTPSSSPTRLVGKSVLDSVIGTMQQTKIIALGTETARKADVWNNLMLGFTNGTIAASVVLPMEINPALPDSTSLLPNGTMRIIAGGVVVNLIPTVFDTAKLSTALSALNPPADLYSNADGTHIIRHNGVIYSLCPEFFIENVDGSSLVFDSNGILRFGNQMLSPAVYNFEQFVGMISKIDSSATVQTQWDGKLAVMIQGKTFILTPDYPVSSSTSVSQAQYEMRDGKLIMNYPFGFSQGFGITVKP